MPSRGQALDAAGIVADPAITVIPLWVDLQAGTAGIGPVVLNLATPEVMVLGVLLGFAGRLVSRELIARKAGLRSCSTRRVDSLLVGIRKALGPESTRTVRGRGWILDLDKVVVPEDVPAGAGLLRVVADPANGPPRSLG